MAMAAQRGIWVISDECYVYLNYTGERFSMGSLREYREHMVIVGSLSKTYAMTGWRTGYALCPAPVLNAMMKLQSQSTSNPTSIVQKAAIAALTGPQECVEEMRLEYIRLRDHVVGGLRAIPGVTCTMPEGAFYAFPNISAFFGRSGVNSASQLAGKAAERSARGSGSGGGFRHQRAHSHLLSDLDEGTGSRVGAHAQLSCRPVKKFALLKDMDELAWAF